MNIQLRPATSNDQKVLLDLFTEHAKHEQHALEITEQPIALQNLEQYPCSIYLICDHQKVIGYLSVLIQFSTWEMSHYLYLDCLYLVKEYRGRSIGHQCLTFIRQLALHKGLKQIQWQTPMTNSSAIRFYKRHGAVAKAKFRFFDQPILGT